MSIDWGLVANVASVIGTVGGLLVWWQLRQIREVNAYEQMRNEDKRWNSPEMRTHRARLARTLLTDQRNFEKIEVDGKEVLGFFETIGLLFHRRLVPIYYVWSILGDDIDHYAQLLRDYLAWLRRSTNDNTYYEDFDLLCAALAALGKKRTGVVKVHSEDDLRTYLEDEVKAAPASEPEKVIPKQTAEVPREDGVISFPCPSCRSPSSAPRACKGRVSKCRKCGQRVVVP